MQPEQQQQQQQQQEQNQPQQSSTSSSEYYEGEDQSEYYDPYRPILMQMNTKQFAHYSYQQMCNHAFSYHKFVQEIQELDKNRQQILHIDIKGDLTQERLQQMIQDKIFCDKIRIRFKTRYSALSEETISKIKMLINSKQPLQEVQFNYHYVVSKAELLMWQKLEQDFKEYKEKIMIYFVYVLFEATQYTEISAYIQEQFKKLVRKLYQIQDSHIDEEEQMVLDNQQMVLAKDQQQQIYEARGIQESDMIKLDVQQNVQGDKQQKMEAEGQNPQHNNDDLCQQQKMEIQEEEDNNEQKMELEEQQ